MRISDWSSDVCSSDLPRSAAFRAAQDVRLIAMLRSDSYRGFATALAGRALKRKYGLQAIAYGTGDYAGPHTDHHPEEPDAVRSYLDMHLSFSRSEEHTSELQSLMRISYAVFCLKKKKRTTSN